MKDDAEEVTTQYSADEGLVSRRVKGGCFGSEEDKLNYCAEGEENYRAAVDRELLVTMTYFFDGLYFMYGGSSARAELRGRGRGFCSLHIIQR